MPAWPLEPRAALVAGGEGAAAEEVALAEEEALAGSGVPVALVVGAEVEDRQGVEGVA